MSVKLYRERTRIFYWRAEDLKGLKQYPRVFEDLKGLKHYPRARRLWVLRSEVKRETNLRIEILSLSFEDLRIEILSLSLLRKH